MYSVFLPIQRLFLRVNEGEFTSLQLADWLMAFSAADLKILTNHSTISKCGTGVLIRYEVPIQRLFLSSFQGVGELVQ